MKKISIIVLAAGLLLSLGFKAAELTKDSAKVDQMEGLYIFHHSKPIKKYKYIGSYTMVTVSSKKATAVLSKTIRKVKKQYPKANAIILKDDMFSCDAVLIE